MKLDEELLQELCEFVPDDISGSRERAIKTLAVAFLYGQFDGAHHRLWAIDQMVRALTGDDYNRFVEHYEEGGDYTWKKGGPP